MKQAQTDYRKRNRANYCLSRCSGQMLKDGEFFDVYEELPGTFSHRRGQRASSGANWGDETITINHVETETRYYQ